MRGGCDKEGKGCQEFPWFKNLDQDTGSVKSYEREDSVGKRGGRGGGTGAGGWCTVWAEHVRGRRGVKRDGKRGETALSVIRGRGTHKGSRTAGWLPPKGECKTAVGVVALETGGESKATRLAYSKQLASCLERRSGQTARGVRLLLCARSQGEKWRRRHSTFSFEEPKSCGGYRARSGRRRWARLDVHVCEGAYRE